MGSMRKLRRSVLGKRDEVARTLDSVIHRAERFMNEGRPRSQLQYVDRGNKAQLQAVIIKYASDAELKVLQRYLK